MNFFKAAVKGVIIGVANIIPGVSGGTMMVSMGVYDTLIGCITNLFKQFMQSIKTLLPYVIGALIGIVALASVLTWLSENYPLPTSTTFIGLILGGLPPLLKRIEMRKVNVFAMILFVLFFAAIVVMAIANPQETETTIDITIGQMILLFGVGVIASATMIIPGVSGSMILMLLGYYFSVLAAVTSLKDGLLGGDFALALDQLKILIPFGLGVVVGIFAVAKLIEWLLKVYPVYTYCAILGLVVASPIAVLFRTEMTGVTPIIVIVSILTFAGGFAFAALLAGRNGEAKLQE